MGVAPFWQRQRWMRAAAACAGSGASCVRYGAWCQWQQRRVLVLQVLFLYSWAVGVVSWAAMLDAAAATGSCAAAVAAANIVCGLGRGAQ